MKKTIENNIQTIVYSDNVTVKTAVSPEPTYSVEILNISSDDTNDIIDLSNNEITCKINSTVSINVEIHNINGSPIGVVDMTQTFRIPIRHGIIERLVLASFTNGSATIQATFSESGLWVITQELINSSLPDDFHFKLDTPIQIFVCL